MQVGCMLKMECATWEYLISLKVSNEEKMGLKVQK